MAMFFKKKEDPAEVAAREAALAANKARLEAFNMTKALGVKKVPSAEQFIYDEAKRQFCVVTGPAETFKDRNPVIVDYDDVSDVFLEVEEWWTEDENKYTPGKGYGILLQEDYKKVFWRYNLICVIRTSNPAAREIRFTMNTTPIIVRILGKGIMVKRGLEMNGEYRGDAISELAKFIAETAEQQLKQYQAGVRYEKLTTLNKKGENIFKEALKDAAKDMKEDLYIKRIEIASKHIERAARISKMLLG